MFQGILAVTHPLFDSRVEGGSRAKVAAPLMLMQWALEAMSAINFYWGFMPAKLFFIET